MVKLDKIYTRGGDKGETSLGSGRRVPKHHIRGAAYGTADEAKGTLYDADLTGPLAVAMGFEGSGLRRLTRERCDEFVCIPMAGAVECLNVSVATGVCLFEARRQRNQAGRK